MAVTVSPPGSRAATPVESSATFAKSEALFSTLALRGRWLRAFALATWGLVVLAQLVTPGLPGAGSGLGRLIDGSEFVTQWLSLLWVLAATTVVVRLGLIVVVERRLPLWLRWVALPAALATAFNAVATLLFPVEDGLLLFASGLAVAGAVGGGAWLIVRGAPRPAAWGLFLGGTTAGLGLVQRLLALRASAEALPELHRVAQFLAEGTVAAKVLLLVAVIAWLPRRLGTLLVTVAGTVLLTWLALRGTDPVASAPWVMLSQGLNSWLRAPLPTLPLVVVVAVELALRWGALVVLVAAEGDRALRAALGLMLLAVSMVDMPPFALITVLATQVLLLGVCIVSADWGLLPLPTVRRVRR